MILSNGQTPVLTHLAGNPTEDLPIGFAQINMDSVHKSTRLCLPKPTELFQKFAVHQSSDVMKSMHLDLPLQRMPKLSFFSQSVRPKTCFSPLGISLETYSIEKRRFFLTSLANLVLTSRRLSLSVNRNQTFSVAIMSNISAIKSSEAG